MSPFPTYPSDFGALLVGPLGQNVVLFNRPGSGSDIVNVDWTFDAAAIAPLPAGGASSSGSFEPSNYASAESFAPGAPTAPYGTDLSVFNGTDPFGTWSLYVQDFVCADAGSICEGWSLEITYDRPPAASVSAAEPMSVLVWSLLGVATMGAVKLRNWSNLPLVLR